MMQLHSSMPWHSLLWFWCPEKQLQLCLQDKAPVSLPISNLANYCWSHAGNHRSQHDEFLENILQYPDRSSEDCFHLDKTIEKRNFLSHTTTQLTMIPSSRPPLKHPVSLPSMGHFSHWAGQGGSGRNERLYKEFPFSKLRSRWLLIIFHANLHLGLHLLVEWSMTPAAGELSLREQYLAQEDDWPLFWTGIWTLLLLDTFESCSLMP